MSQADILRPQDLMHNSILDTTPQQAADAEYILQADYTPKIQPIFSPHEDIVTQSAFNLEAANQFSQQHIFKARQFAKENNVSFEDAIRFADTSQFIQQRVDPETLKNMSPRLLKSLARGTAAWLVKDELKLLNDMSIAFDEHAAGQDMFISKDVADSYLSQMPTGHYRKATRLKEGMQQVGDAVFNTALGMVESSATTLLKTPEEGGPVVQGYANFLKELGQLMREKLENEKAGREPELAPIEGFQSYLEDVIKVAPQIISSVIVGAASGGAGATFMASQITGSKYDTLHEKGVDADSAMAAALHSTLWQLPLERISIDKFLDIFKASGTLNVLKAVGGATVTEGITEWLQQYPDEASSIFAETFQKGGTVNEAVETFFGNFWDITKQGIYSGLVAAPFGAGFGAIHVASGKAGLNKPDFTRVIDALPPQLAEVLTQEATQALHMNQRHALTASLSKAAEHADQSALKKEDPEALQEVVAPLIPEHYAQTWLGADDAHSLYQSALENGAAEAENLLQTLQTDAQSLQQAIESGNPLPVNTAAVVTQASQNNRPSLIAALRVSPDGPSGTEAQNFDPQARMQAALADIRTSQQVRSEVQKEVTRIKNEMIQAGEPKHVAETYTALHSAQALAAHAAYGVDPVQLMQRRIFKRNDEQSPVQDDAPQLSQAAMYRNRAASVKDFINVAMLEKGNDKSFYGLGNVERADGQASGEVILAADNVRHIAARHPEFTEWEKIQDAIANGKAILSGKNKITGRDAYVFIQNEGEKSIAVVASSTESKSLGKRIFVTTAFKDSTARVETWLKENTAFYQDAGGSPAYPSPIAGNVPPALKNGVSSTHINPAVDSVKSFYQPLNEGINLDAPVQVVTVQPRFAGKQLWEVMKGEIPAQLKKELSGTYKNTHTGWNISLSSKGIGHAISSASSRGSGGIPHMEAVANLPSLIQNAVLVESHKDSKNRGLKAVHRMYAPMQEGQHVYAVKLTVKEYPKEMVAEIEDIRKLYDLSLEAEISKDLFVTPPDTKSGALAGSVLPTLDISEEQSDSLSQLPPTPEMGTSTASNLYSSEMPTVTALKDPKGFIERPLMSISSVRLRELLADVNDNEGNSFFQSQAQQSRGVTSFKHGKALVKLFENADLSTIPHESMHIFLDDLMRIAEDKGDIALQEMQRRIVTLLDSASKQAAAPVPPFISTVMQAEVDPQKRMQALREASASLGQMAAEATANAQNLQASVQNMQEQQIPVAPLHLPPWSELATEGTRARAEASLYLRVQTILKGTITHLQGLDKARTDMTTLREFANVPLEGDLSEKQYRQLHEATAQGFEQYLMDGKAPSHELKSVFSRIRAWLLDVYKVARDSLGLPITDNVRAVFDRMLATDKQMRQSRQLQQVLQSEDAFIDSEGIDYEEWQDLQALRNEAEREVQAAMDKATLRDRANRRKQHLKEAQNFLADDPFWNMIDNIAARTKDPADPTAPTRGGISKESVARLIGVEQTVELSRRRRGIINVQGQGMPLDIVAKENGYENEDEFITTIYDRLVVREESRKKLAEAIAEQSMAEEDAQAETDGLAAGTDAYAKYLDKVDEVVLAMATRKRGYRTVAEQQRSVYTLITPRTRVRMQASEEINFTPLRDINPARYHNMLAKALKDRQIALAKGEPMRAVKAVYNARVANEMISLSRSILSQREDMENLAARLAAAKPGTFPTLHREAMRHVLAQYNLGRMRGTADPEFSNASLRDLIKASQGDTIMDIAPSFAPWILDNRDPNTQKPQQYKAFDYRGLTPNQLQDVRNILEYLQKTGYDARTDRKNAEAAKVTLLVGQAAEAMTPLEDRQQASEGSTRRKIQDTLSSIYGSIDALRWQVRKADAFSNLMGNAQKGPMEAAILDKVLEGEARARQRIDAMSSAMAPALTRLAASVTQWEKMYGTKLLLKDANGTPIQVPESIAKAYGRKNWTADMVIAMALNMGNESNIARITSGYEDLNYEMIAVLLGDQVANRVFATKGITAPVNAGQPRYGLLSLQDWQDIQSIWDTIATQWPDTQNTHERMFGFKPTGIAASPLRLTDAQGGSILLDGGYYPVRYDPQVSERVGAWAEQEDILSRNEALFAVPSAKRGHTKAREDGPPELPLRLDTGVLMEHINDAVRFIELAEITRYADKVTSAPAFRYQYIRAFGKHDYDAIRPNLRGLVRQEPPPRGDTLVTLANAVRKYLVPWGLAWNLKVAALQLTAVYPAMGDIGAKPIMDGISHIATKRMDAIRAVWDASPYMLSRKDNIDQDLQRNIANFTPSKRPASITLAGKEFSWESFVEAGMLPIVAVDTVATTAVWMGAYTKKLSQLQGQKLKTAIDKSSPYHEEAAQFADSVVKQSNPDYDSSSRSGFLRAQNSYRLVNAFCSAVTLFAQRHKYMYTAHAKGKISTTRLLRFEMFDTLIPAVSVFMLLALARGMFGGEDKDKEDLTKLFISTGFDFTSMRLPIFGSLASDLVMNVLNVEDGSPKRGDGMRTVLDTPMKLFDIASGRAGKAAWEGLDNDEQLKRLMYGVGDIASFASRVPVSKLIRNAERGYDQWQRDEGTPLSILLPRPGK